MYVYSHRSNLAYHTNTAPASAPPSAERSRSEHAGRDLRQLPVLVLPGHLRPARLLPPGAGRGHRLRRRVQDDADAGGGGLYTAVCLLSSSAFSINVAI